MASVWPAKNNYATGDVLTAANMNGVGDDLNDVYNFSGYAAGKNKIINGDFSINQRNFSSTTAGGYGFDRWQVGATDGTTTYSSQTFTAGAAPVSGYEAKNFAQIASTGQTLAGAYSILIQKIESVRTFAGQTATISFWAKAASGTPKVAVEVTQTFGTGGSPSADVNTYAGQVTLSTSWARYSVTVAIPSISGKTVGTTTDGSLDLFLWTSAGTTFNSRTGSLGIQTATIGFWGVQVEAGSTASIFQTATGTKQGELAACQRYYWRTTAEGAYGIYGAGNASSTSALIAQVKLPVTMRTTPTVLEYSNVGWNNLFNAGAGGTTLTYLSSACNKDSVGVTLSSSSGLTAGSWYFLTSNNNTSGYIGIGAEL